MAKVTVYSIGCPKCIVLEKKLKSEGIPFEVCNDVDTIKELGFSVLPMMQVDTNILDFNHSIKWIKECKKVGVSV